MEMDNGTDPEEQKSEEMSSSESVWSVNPEDYPDQGTLREKGRFLLRYAHLAPSIENAQPWSFQLQDDHIRMSGRRRGTSGSSLRARDIYFSLGCAVENLSVAAGHFEHSHRVSYVPEGRSASLDVDLDPDWTFGEYKVTEVFEQLTEDHVCATELEDRKLSYEHKELIRGVTCEDVVLLNLLEGAGGMGKILKFRAKIHDTLSEHQNQNNEAPSSEGRTQEETQDQQGLLHRILEYVRSWFPSNTNQEQSEEPRERDSSSTSDTYEPPNPLPPAVVLSGWVDGPISWIKCGRVFQRVSLLLGRENVQVQPFHDVMAHSTAREEVSRMIDSPQETIPLFLFRVGYVSDEEEQSSRVPLEDVLIES